MRKHWHVVKDLPPSRGEQIKEKAGVVGYVLWGLVFAGSVLVSVTALGFLLGTFLSAVFRGS